MQNYIPELVIGGNVIRKLKNKSSQRFFCFLFLSMHRLYPEQRTWGKHSRFCHIDTLYFKEGKKKLFSSFKSEWNRLNTERGTRVLTASKETATHACLHQSDSHALRMDRQQHTHGITVSQDLKLHLQTLGAQSPVVYLPLFSTCKVSGYCDSWCIFA